MFDPLSGLIFNLALPPPPHLPQAILIKFFTHFKLFLANANHNFKRVKKTHTLIWFFTIR